MANVVDDFLDGIADWFVDTMKELITDQIEFGFNILNTLMTATYVKATESDGWFASFFAHPAEFTGLASSSSGGTTIWSIIETLCNNVVVPIAGFILAIVLVNDLIQMCIRGNSFREVDVDFFIKWIIKSLCGIILVANTYYIASGLFAFGTEVTANGITTLFGRNGTLQQIDLTQLHNALTNGNYSVGELLMVSGLTSFFVIIMAIFMAAVILVMASRIIEVFMYLSISPIPMATLMNKEWGYIGKSWIRGVLALSFQGFFIVVAMAIFKTTFNNIVSTIISGDSIITSMVILTGYAAALIFTVLRSGSISKSIFSAA